MNDSKTRYEAIVLDLDGTLLSEQGQIHPRTRAALHEAARRGIRVMVATGRSEGSAAEIVEELGFDTPAVLYNGAAVYCPLRKTLIEERTFTPEVLDRIMDFAEERGYLTVAMRAGSKHAMAPRSEAERLALHDMRHLRVVSLAEMRAPRTIRVSLFAEQHASAEEFVAELVSVVDTPLYLTHFPLNLLPAHRGSELTVIDVHPPCQGKGEAIRILEERYGIPAAKVVAVGDAPNDLPLFELAGLSVAMEGAMEVAKGAAHRIIGTCDSDAIGALVEELFLS